MAKPAFSIAPVTIALQQNEIYFHLYLHHTPQGANHNQSVIVDPKLPNAFGLTAVNDWPLYDGLGPNAKVIARAQGLHIQAGITSTGNENWQNYFSIMFEDARFKGSTLQVMGPVVGNGEWGIVGGTGQFQLAQGIIFKKGAGAAQKEDSTTNLVELDIHAFYSSVRPWTLGV